MKDTLPSEHEKWMQRCIELAKKGKEHAAPNPMVGAVIVFDNEIIGEGYHIRCGKEHAEVNALRSVRAENRKYLKYSAIYVSLEPCSHYGKTPPCAQLIIRSGIPKVVIGCKDPFERVSGKGIEMLRKAGIEVITGVLEQECLDLNRRFMLFQTQKRPYITLKWARSADGFLDAWRDTPDIPPVKLSTPRSQIFVHRLRAGHKAILVGHRTLLLDKPQLTARDWPGSDPAPIVLGKVEERELPSGWQAYADVPTMLESLRKQNLQSLLVEGGGQTLQTFIDEGWWDEAYEELSAVKLSSGVPAPHMPNGAEKEILTYFDIPFSHWKNT